MEVNARWFKLMLKHTSEKEIVCHYICIVFTGKEEITN